MRDWIRHTYRKRPPRHSVKEGNATLKDTNNEAPPVNDVPIAGFARPLHTPKQEQQEND